MRQSTFVSSHELRARIRHLIHPVEHKLQRIARYAGDQWPYEMPFRERGLESLAMALGKDERISQSPGDHSIQQLTWKQLGLDSIANRLEYRANQSPNSTKQLLTPLSLAQQKVPGLTNDEVFSLDT